MAEPYTVTMLFTMEDRLARLERLLGVQPPPVPKKAPPSSTSEWLTVREVAEEANVHRRTVDRWIQRGLLGATKADNGIEDFLRFMGRSS